MKASVQHSRVNTSTHKLNTFCIYTYSFEHVSDNLTNHLSGHEHEADCAGGDQLPSCQTSCVTLSLRHCVDLLTEPLRLPQTVHTRGIVAELRVRVFVLWRLYPERKHTEQKTSALNLVIK